MILASFDAWGEKCLNKFNGMWALAIWDHAKQRLFLSRDRFGKKPLFYAFIKDENNQNKFIFASEMKAIYPFLKEIKPSANFSHFAKLQNLFDYESTRETLIDGISHFPAAHFAFLDSENLKNATPNTQLATTRYYNLLDNLNFTHISYENAVQKFRELFLDAVKIRMRSDVRVGTALSGGVDSSAVMCAMSHLSKTQDLKRENKDWQHACVACFAGTPLDESQYAKAVCEHIGIQGEFLEINPLAHWEQIEKYFYLFEDIYMTSPVPMIATYGAIKAQGVSVTLDGHGADELFSGYGHLANAMWDAKFNPVRLLDVARTFDNTLENQGGAAKQILKFFTKMTLTKTPILRDFVQKARPTLRDNFVKIKHKNFDKMDYLTQSLYDIITRTYMPTLLRNYDRYSMINSVEIRMPFLDHRLVEFVFSLPYDYKIRGGYTKRLIRDSMVQFMPDPVIWRKSKIGFNSPILHWMQRGKNENGLKEWFLDLVNSRDFLECSLIENTQKLKYDVEKICNKQAGNYNSAVQKWCEINPYLWQKSIQKFAIRF